MRYAEIPLVRLFFPFLGGIILPLVFPVSLLVVVILLAAGISFLILIKLFPPSFSFRYGWYQGVIISVLFMAGGMFRAIVAEKVRMDNSGIMEANRIIAVVAGYPLERKKTCRFPVRVRGYYSNGWVKPDHGVFVMVYVLKNDDRILRLTPGTGIFIRSEVRQIPFYGNPGEFNYRRYMADQRIYGRVFCRTGEWRILRGYEKPSLTGVAANLQHKLVMKLKNAGFDDRELAVAAALMAGERNLLDRDTKQMFSQSGGMHVLAISGLHVGIIYFILFYILLFLERIRYGKLLRSLFVFGVIWTYALVTGLSPSVTRASVMFSFFLLGDLLDRQSNPLNILAASAFFMLLINPYLVRSAGFLLSYLAVTGIILFYPSIRRWGVTGHFLWDKTWSLIALSLAAQIGTAPLSVFFFHQFPVWFTLTNLLIIPIVTLIVYGFLLWLITIPAGWLAGVVLRMLKFLVSLLIKAVSLVQSMPLSVVSGLHTTPVTMVIIYLLIWSLFLFLIYRKTVSFFVFQGALLVYMILEFSRIVCPSGTFTVFNIPGKSVAVYQTGSGPVIFDFSPVQLTGEEISYFMGIYAGKKDSRYILPWESTFPTSSNENGEYGFYYRKGFLCFPGLKVLYFNSAQPPLLRTMKISDRMDILIFSGNRWWNLFPLLDRIPVNMIILDSTVPVYVSQQISLRCMERKIPVYYVGQRGAYSTGL